MELLGRAKERDALDAAWAEARAGRGGVVAVVGEAGIGKSRLVGEVAASAGRVARGQAWEEGGAPALWPWSEVLRDLGADPELLAPLARGPADGDAPSDLRFRAFDAACRALRQAAGDGLLVVIEDLHAADPASRRLAAFAARALRGSRVLVVATTRPEGLDAWAADARLVRLGPLGAEDVGAWSARVAPGEDPTRLLDRSGGNPLLVELLLAFGGEVGEVAPLVLARCASLPEGVRRDLGRAAVLGRSPSPGELATVTGGDPALLGDRAVRAGLWIQRAGGWAWRHDLVREALLADLSEVERRAAHLAAAEARGGGPGEAVHRLAAGDLDGALAAVEREARAAVAHVGFEAAAELTARVVDALGPDDPRLGDWLIRLGHACRMAGDDAGVKQATARAFARGRAAGDARLMAEAALVAAHEVAYGVVEADRRDQLRDALDALGPGGDVALRARVGARLASAMVPGAGQAAAIPLARESVALARASGDPAVLLHTLRWGTAALAHQVPFAEVAPWMRETLALVASLGDVALLAECGPWAVTLRLHAGDFAGAVAETESLAHRAAALGHPRWSWRVLLLRRALAVARGDPAGEEEAEAVFRAVATSESPALQRGARMLQVTEAFLAHDLATFDRLGGLALFRGSPGERAARLWRAAMAGEHAQARALAEGMDFAALNLPWQMVAAEGVARAGTPAQARALEAALGSPESVFIPFGLIPLSVCGPRARVAGLLAWRGGDTLRARRLLRDAERACVAAGAGRWLEQVRRHLARIETSEEAAHGRASEPAPAVASASRPEAPPPASPFLPVRLERVGSGWELRAGAERCVLADGRGPEWLAVLLACPGRDVAATELAGVVESDGGEHLDTAAVHAYRERVTTLRAELDDPHHGARARAELEALEDELARAVGQGGRLRRAGSAAERARINVQRRLRHVLAEIAGQRPALAAWIEAGLRTGARCRWTPPG